MASYLTNWSSCVSFPLIVPGTTWLSSASWSPSRMRSLDLSKLHWVHYPVCFSSIPSTPISASHALLPLMFMCLIILSTTHVIRGFSKTTSLSGKAYIHTTHPQIDPHVSRYCNLRNGVSVPTSGDLVLVTLHPLFGVLISSFSFLFSYSSPILC
jgi:hypothetical protein